MNVGWVIALVNAGMVAAFGAFLMWRTRATIRQRLTALEAADAARVGPDEQRAKARRLAELREEVRRLERELGEVTGTEPSVPIA